jgi:DNA-binding IclR family transcriptional regulator
MMDTLGVLERREDGASITEITQTLRLPRTTIYRILNTLEAHDVVRRDRSGAYRLGRRILSLASHVTASVIDVDIVSLAQPILDRLAAELVASVKLSVIDHEGVLVVAVAQGRRAYALTVTRGQRMAPHAGAAGKLLLAHLPSDELARWLATPLAAFTTQTVTDPRRLRAELGRIRRQGWAQDRGESAPSICAFAAPVVDRQGRVLAAVSLPFLAGAEDARLSELRSAVIGAAQAISEAMPR